MDYCNWSIEDYQFLIRRQRMMDIEGRIKEISAILTLDINSIVIGEEKDVNQIVICFRSKGSRRTKTMYSNFGSKKQMVIELPNEDLIVWMQGVQSTHRSLDIIYTGSIEFVDVYLNVLNSRFEERNKVAKELYHQYSLRDKCIE